MLVVTHIKNKIKNTKLPILVLIRSSFICWAKLDSIHSSSSSLSIRRYLSNNTQVIILTFPFAVIEQSIHVQN